MVIANGKFDGKQIVMDSIPQGVLPDTPVRIVFVQKGKSFSLEAIAAMAVKGGLPQDFASGVVPFVSMAVVALELIMLRRENARY